MRSVPSYGKRPHAVTAPMDGQVHSAVDQSMTKGCTMYQAFVRAAAAVLSTALLSSGAVVLAQTTEPQPTTMVDTAPLPASDRNSVGRDPDG